MASGGPMLDVGGFLASFGREKSRLHVITTRIVSLDTGVPAGRVRHERRAGANASPTSVLQPVIGMPGPLPDSANRVDEPCNSGRLSELSLPCYRRASRDGPFAPCPSACRPSTMEWTETGRGVDSVDAML